VASGTQANELHGIDAQRHLAFDKIFPVTNEQHNRYAAYALLANAGFYLLIFGLMAAMFIVFGLWGPPGEPGPPPAFFAFMFAFMAFFYALFALPSVIAGYGMLKQKSWARTAGIIAGVIAAMNFPIGTGAAVYALWFFFSDNWKEIYSDGYSFAPPPPQIAYGVESQRAAYAEAEREPQPRFDPYNPPDWR
jgi:hypothetical protein